MTHHQIQIEFMSTSEFQDQTTDLKISYFFHNSPFGQILTANTDKGLCYLAFHTENKQALKELKALFPHAQYLQESTQTQKNALQRFTSQKANTDQFTPIKLHLKATPFQAKVWSELIKIPSGKLSTYGEIAKKIDNPQAHRAVGSAVGKNPIAMIIPCHRIIQSSGKLGEYHWGKELKAQIIEAEKN